MTSGNHIADQGQKEYNERGLCPLCHKGYLEDAEWCPHEDQECDSNLCPVGDDCFDGQKSSKCPKCGYITKEIE